MYTWTKAMYYLVLPIMNIPAPPSQNYPVAPLQTICRVYKKSSLRVFFYLKLNKQGLKGFLDGNFYFLWGTNDFFYSQPFSDRKNEFISVCSRQKKHQLYTLSMPTRVEISDPSTGIKMHFFRPKTYFNQQSVNLGLFSDMYTTYRRYFF